MGSTVGWTFKIEERKIVQIRISLVLTQVELSSIHERSVPDRSMFGIGMSVAIGKKSRGNESDCSEEDDAERAEDPPELSHAPS